MHFLIATILWLNLFAITACAQDTELPPPRPQQQSPSAAKPQSTPTPAPRLPADPNKYAVIISGISGEEAYTKQFTKWTADLRETLLARLGFAEDHLYVLTEKPGAQEQRAAADIVKQTFATLRSDCKTDNQVFIFFIGHGSFDGKIAKFNLIGPDLTATDYAQLIKALPTRNVVVVNMSSASGEFIKPLSANGHIVVTATRSGMEQNATRFAEHFIAALGNAEADTDKNSRVSVLEAFEYATKLTAAAFEKKGTLATEHALLDDNGDGTGHQKAEAGDGALAKTTYFDSLPQQQAGGDAELAKLFAERGRLEGAVELLKARKAQMKEEEYEAELEKMLLELAKLGQTIRSKKK